jgi:hypothetical protein
MSSEIRGKMLQKKSSALLVGIFGVVIGLPAVIVVRPFLPAKYDFDSNTIQVLTSGRISVADPNFQRVADFYSFLGMGESLLLASVVGFLAYLSLILLVIDRANLRITEARGYVPILVSLACGVAFLGAYSKEFVLVLFLIIFFILAVKKNRIFSPFLVLLSYGLVFRSYWVAIACIWLFLALAWKFRPSLKQPWFVLLTFIGVLVAFPIAASAVNLDLASLRFGLNEMRLGSDVANTAIEDFLPSQNPLVQALNALLVACSLIVPVPLVLQFNLIYFAFFIAIVSISMTFILNLRARIQENSEMLTLPLIVVAVFSIQVFFEPDYGSYLRHLTPLLPFVILLLGANGSKENKTQLRRNPKYKFHDLDKNIS